MNAQEIMTSTYVCGAQDTWGPGLQPIRTVAMLAILLLTAMLGTQRAVAQVLLQAGDPRTENVREPSGIDVSDPRFTWILDSEQRGVEQIAYQILVADAARKLTEDEANLWNTGKVPSSRTVNVPYTGRPIESSTRYFWKVRSWNGDGEPGPWSPIASFHTGVLDSSEWKARWIGARDTTNRAPLLRKQFDVPDDMVAATAHVSGLGYYELYLNGEKVGDHVLDPSPTQYEQRVLYETYDVTDQLREGENAVGLWLAEGQAASTIQDSSRFFSHPRPYPGPDLFETPRGLLQLEITRENGQTQHVVTDASWKTSTGPITYNHFYGGEDYDARQEKSGWSRPGYDDGAWSPATINDVEARLSGQVLPAIKVIDTLEPVARTHPEPGTYVFDLGQNIGGWWRITVKGKRGTRVTVRGSETLDGETYPKPLTEGSTISMEAHHGLGGYYFRDALTTYTLKGDGVEVYEPRFFYSGFRYLQVDVDDPETLDLMNVEGRTVHSAVERIGSFTSSNELFNRIHQNMVWTLKSNLQGAPMSNPHSEKYGWTGDAHLNAEPANHSFDMAAFWRKWLQDIRDVQLLIGTGHIPATIPNYRKHWKSTSSVWGGAYPLIVWYTYKYYDDERVLRTFYPGLQAWTDYLTSISEGHLVDSGSGGHVPPGFGPDGEYITRNRVPETALLVSTAYYYKTVYLLARMAEQLGKDDDAAYYEALSEDIGDAFHSAFFDAEAGLYRGEEPAPPGFHSLQTANLVPLQLGLVPDELRDQVVEHVVRDIIETHDRHLGTDIMSTKSLVNVLPDEGYQDLLYELASQRTYPGWGYWVERGATTHWQHWDSRGDHSHAMFGTIDEFFFNDLAGIQAPTDQGTSAGYRHVHIRPYVPDTMQYAAATIKSVRGRISSAWEQREDALVIEVTLPPNTTGVVSVPAPDPDNAVILEGNVPVWRRGEPTGSRADIRAGVAEDGYVSFEVGSGTYTFIAR